MGASLPQEVLSHWNKMVEGLSQSSDQFYQETQAGLDKHKLKKVNLSRVNLSEGGIFSANREYLQVKHEGFVYHVCAAPYGNGFFVSSWLGVLDEGFWAFMATIPYLGAVVRFFRSFFKPMTYYRIDTLEMFHAVVHGAVTDALDAALKQKGLRALTETDRKPVMKDVLNLL